MAKRGRKPFKCGYCELDLHLVLRPVHVDELKHWFCEFKCIEHYRYKLEKGKELCATK